MFTGTGGFTLKHQREENDVSLLEVRLTTTGAQELRISVVDIEDTTQEIVVTVRWKFQKERWRRNRIFVLIIFQAVNTQVLFSTAVKEKSVVHHCFYFAKRMDLRNKCCGISYCSLSDIRIHYFVSIKQGSMVADFNSNLYNVSSVTQVMNTTTNTTEDVTITRTFDDIVGSMKVKSVKPHLGRKWPNEIWFFQDQFLRFTKW